MEEDVTLRRMSESGGRQKLNSARTPTAIVSEVFGFLNDTALASVSDDNNELIMSDSEVDRLFSNLDLDEADARDSVADTLLIKSSHQEKFLAEFPCKDSGFASLERQKCEVGNLYDSFFENDDDDTEDVIESPLSYDAGAGICDSFYDDVELCSVPRSISIEARSDRVDNETENAIVSSAETFSSQACEPNSEASGQDKDPVNNQDNVDGASMCPIIHKSIINIVMVNKPVVDDHNSSTVKTDPTSSDSIHIDINRNISKEHPRGGCDEDSIPAPSDRVTLAEENNANVYDFVIKADPTYNNIPPQVKSSLSNEESVLVDNLYEFSEQENDSSFSLLYDENKKLCSVGEESYNSTSVSITSVSFDEDEDDDNNNDEDEAAISYYPVDASDQAYDTIDFNWHGSCPASEQVLVTEDGVTQNAEDCGSEALFSEEGMNIATEQVEPINNKSLVNVQRRTKLEKNLGAEMASDDSSDEDVGIYAESFRRSNWVRLSQQGNIELKTPEMARSSIPRPVSLRLAQSSMGSSSTDSADVGGGALYSPASDEVFTQQATAPHTKMLHKRTDSMSTTVSETEFKCQYVSRRKCFIQRNDSQQEYHRLSSKVYDQDKQVVLQRISNSEELGLHLLGSHPAFITAVDPGSVAEKAGLSEGQILVSVNDQNVLNTSHADIVELIQSLKGDIKLGVTNSDMQPARDPQVAVMAGYLYKLGNSTFKIWKKRYFILRQDNCLYYYKNEQESDPLGALPLCGYTISRHTETNRDFCFKAEKYGGRTYYFIADNRDQMTTWVSALTVAAAQSKKRESFLSVSSHNVGLPALHILSPECAGFLGKLSPSKHSWRRRYCVLKDACVYYYKDRSSISALGVAHLHGYTVDVENYQRRKFSFTLHPPEKKMRIFCFSADNETDKKRWVESLIHSIQRWVRVDKEVEC